MGRPKTNRHVEELSLLFCTLELMSNETVCRNRDNRKGKALKILSGVGDLVINHLLLWTLIPSQSITLHNHTGTSLLFLSPPKDKPGWGFSLGDWQRSMSLSYIPIRQTLSPHCLTHDYSFLVINILCIISNLMVQLLKVSQLRRVQLKRKLKCVG